MLVIGIRGDNWGWSLCWVEQFWRSERAPGDHPHPAPMILQLKSPKPREGKAFTLVHTAD